MNREISHYIISDKLGQGGMGTVYKAEDSRLKRNVALKFLPQELTTDPEIKERFIREAQTASTLQHKNICTIHEIDETSDGQLFISMDYYEGETLRQILAKDRLPFRTALDYAIQIAEGLEEAHKNGIIHRDIKPGNVMITKDGIVKILDFGLAKSSGTESLTSSGKFMGTVSYSSPEQVQGLKTDHLTDIWSLGVVLYEMFTLQLPFDHEHEAAIIYSIIDKSPEPPTELHDDIPAELERIIYKCLKKTKEERYQSAEQLLADLRNLRMVFEGKSKTDKRKIPDTKREAERRPATILNAEISGYHELKDKLDVEEINSIMSRCSENIFTIASQFGGTFKRISSNHFMIFLGVPKAEEDAPKQCVNAGIRLRDMLHRFNKNEKLPVQLSLRTGIDTGTIISDSVITDDRKEQHVVGDSVDFAAHLKDLSVRGQILVGPLTYKYTKDDFDYIPFRSISSKGRKQQVTIYELLSTREKIHRVRPGTERMISAEMVGREKELDKLQYHLLKVIDGEGSIVSVIGEAGIGKSRLLAELRKKEQISRVTLLEGRALSNGTNLSYHPIVDILKSLAEIKEDDSEKEAFFKVEKSIQQIYPENAAEVFPFIATMMGMKLSGKYAERIRGIEGEALEKLILKNLRELLAKAAGQRPIVMVVEDLHWADLSSVELLGSLYRLAENARILFINVFRPNYRETGEQILTTIKNRYEKHHAEICLESLNENQSEKLVSSLLKIKILPTKINRLITERTEGNPFFIEEIVRSFIDDGIVVFENGEFQVSEKIESVVIPETIDELLMARIDKLDENTRTLMKVASVIGRYFFYKILCEIVKETEKIDEELMYLQQVQLILERRRMDEVEYLFKHALVQQAVYNTLLIKQKKRLHSEVARAFETVFQDRLPDFYGTLAYHYSMAEELDKAENYLILAGEKALKSSASNEAINYYKEALNIYKKKHGDDADPKKIAILEKNIGIALFNKGHFIDASEYLGRTLSYHGMKISNSPFPAMISFIYGLSSLVLKAYFPSLMGNKIPSEAELEIHELLKTRVFTLTITDAKRFIIELISYSPWYTKFDVRKCDILLLVGVAFSYGGLSLRIGKRILDYYGERFDKEDPRLLLGYKISLNNHNLLSGDWHNEHYNDNYIKKSYYFGVTNELVTYIGFLAHIHLERGDRSAEQILENLAGFADSYENDYGRLARYTHLALCLLKFRELNKALERANLGIDFISKTLGNRPGLLMIHSLKMRIQVFLGDMEGASETMQIAKEIADKDIYAPFFSTFYLTGRFMLEISSLEKAIADKDIPNYRMLRKNAVKSGKRAVRVCRKAAYEITETYRLMGIYYWITGKQKKALKWWEKSIRAAERIGARLELSRTFMEVGRRLSEPKSKHQKLNGMDAGMYLQKARKLFEEMDLKWDLKELEKLI
jgi:serine/threonine protein kinase/tetratricopeptide (TPR) repeat protein